MQSSKAERRSRAEQTTKAKPQHPDALPDPCPYHAHASQMDLTYPTPWQNEKGRKEKRRPMRAPGCKVGISSIHPSGQPCRERKRAKRQIDPAPLPFPCPSPAPMMISPLCGACSVHDPFRVYDRDRPMQRQCPVKKGSIPFRVHSKQTAKTAKQKEIHSVVGHGVEVESRFNIPSIQFSQFG